MSEFRKWLLKPWAVRLIDVIGALPFFPLLFLAVLYRDPVLISVAILTFIVSVFFYYSGRAR
jgi:ABC-type dipeptide/oligopeptide/nickel transport system permease subunit